MAKLYRKMRDIIERCFRMGERQAPKIESAKLKLSAMGFPGAFLHLNAKRHRSQVPWLRPRRNPAAPQTKNDHLS